MRQTLWILLVALGFAVLPLRAQVSDAAIAKARAAVGSKVLRCSPDGADGTLKPLQALAQLKRGMELVLLPGKYDVPQMEIVADRVVVRGEGTGQCRVNLTISGKNCVVRDLCFNELTIVGDGTTIVDCMLGGISLKGEDSRRKARHALYNCGLRRLHCFAYNAKLEMRNCTMIAYDIPPNAAAESEYGPIYCIPESELNIENSVLCASGVLFHFRVYGRRQPKLALKNNLIFGKAGLARIYGDGPGDKNPKVSFDLKEFRRQANITLQGETLCDEPVFMPPQPHPPSSPDAPRIRCAGLFLEQFRLAADSPGTGRGLVLTQHPFFDKALASAPPDETVETPPPPPPPSTVDPVPGPDQDPAPDKDPLPAEDKDDDEGEDEDPLIPPGFDDFLIPPPPPPPPPPTPTPEP
jgi:hypothetical protein